MPRETPLIDLPRGRVAIVAGISTTDAVMEARLREIGVAEGDEAEILHFGPLGATPVSVRLNRTMIAMRREEARAILITGDGEAV